MRTFVQCEVFNDILHSDRKLLVTSFPADLWSRLSSIRLYNFMILSWTVLEKFHTKPSEAVFSTVCPYNFRTEVDIDVISGMDVENVGMDVCLKFDDSRSNGLRDTRGADFFSNERTWRSLSYPNSVKCLLGVSPKNCRKYRLRRLQVDFIEKGLSEDHQISQVVGDNWSPQICRIWHRYLLPVDCKMQLNTAEKWCVKWVRPGKESSNSATA